MSSQDISEAFEDWDFEPGLITVRKILGEDGKEKIQMRVELGLIQMEVTGRPDGKRPNGMESYLEYQKAERDKYVEDHENDFGFSLNVEECAQLREESLYYYYRYLSLFHLNEFEQVASDTKRNLQAGLLLRKYAEEDEDRYSIEQYRPYILMMNTQARARLASVEGRQYDALGIVKEGRRKILKFIDQNFELFGISEDCPEMSILESLEQEIMVDLPDDSIERLRSELNKAVAAQEFEKAASLRDRIRSMEDDG
jgi:hypothetical protein